MVPKTPENAPTPPAKAAIVGPRQARKVLVEERAWERPAKAPAEQPVEAGQSMDTAKAQKRRNETEADILAEGNPTRSRLEPDARPSTRTLYPPSCAGIVATMDMVEAMTVATVYEFDDGWAFWSGQRRKGVLCNIHGFWP